MANCNDKHLPQICYFYDGYIFPFIGKADLKTLINWRRDKLKSDSFYGYSKDARNTYFEHLACIEQCIRILFSNPNPGKALDGLARKKEVLAIQNKRESQASNDLFIKLTARKQSELIALAKKYLAE